MNALDQIDQPSVYELARGGNFRAIAQWLNNALVPHQIYAWVGEAKPGWLKILVEFPRSPERDRLIRFIGHRLGRLNAPVIEGFCLAGRQVNQSRILWSCSVRVIAPTASKPQRHLPGTPTPAAQRFASLQQSSQVAATQLSTLMRQQLKHPRAKWVGSSAAAAFLLGGSIEMVSHQTTASASRPIPEIAETASSSPAQVKAALENVSVIQHPVRNPNNSTITLAFSGEGALGDWDGTADLSSEPALDSLDFSGMTAYQQADVALTSLNTPLAAPGTFSADAAEFDPLGALVEGGVDIVNLANNELAAGSEPLTDTLSALDQTGIHTVGAGHDLLEARRPEILDVKGQRIAYLGYSNSDLYSAGEGAIGINPGFSERIAEDIHAIRDQVDWVVVNYHWNDGLEETPGEWQIDLAHVAIDEGADLVVGHHPNVLQGAEIYKGRAIAYSLGNFSPEDANAATTGEYETAILKVSLRNHQMRLELLPVKVQDAKPAIVDGEQAEQILQHLEQISDTFAEPLRSPTVLDARTTAQERDVAPAEPSAEPMPASDPELRAEPKDELNPDEKIDAEVGPSRSDSDSVNLEPAQFPRSLNQSESSDFPGADASDSFITYPDAPASDAEKELEPEPDAQNLGDEGPEIDRFQPSSFPAPPERDNSSEPQDLSAAPSHAEPLAQPSETIAARQSSPESVSFQITPEAHDSAHSGDRAVLKLPKIDPI